MLNGTRLCAGFSVPVQGGVHVVHLPPDTTSFSGPKSPGVNWLVYFELIITPSSTVPVGSLIAFSICPSLLVSIVLN